MILKFFQQYIFQTFLVLACNFSMKQGIPVIKCQNVTSLVAESDVWPIFSSFNPLFIKIWSLLLVTITDMCCMRILKSFSLILERIA